MPESIDRDHDLLERYLHDQLSDTETAEVGRRIASDPQVARRVAELASMEMRLAELLDPGAQAPVGVVAPRRRRGRGIALGACALCLLVVGAVWLGRRGREATVASARQPPSQIVAAPPPFIDRPRAPVVAGATDRDLDGRIEELAGVVVAAIPGNMLQPARGPLPDQTRGLTTVGAGSWLRLVDERGARLELSGDSALHGLTVAANGAESSGWYLSRGGLVAQMPRAGATHTLVTPDAVVRAAPGTRLALAATPVSSRVEVTAGAVQLSDRRLALPFEVRAGSRALLGAGPPLTSTRRQGLAVFLGANVPAERRDPEITRADQLIEERLWAHGFEVRRSLASQSVDADLAAATLVVISASVRINDVDMLVLRGLPVPMIVWETGAFPLLGMAQGAAESARSPAANAAPLTVTAPEHPVAAKLHGQVRVVDAGFLGWGRPPADAVRVLVWPDRPERAALFALERGGASTIDGLRIPARRVGLFLRGSAAAHLTGDGWRLIDASIAWAIEPPAR